MIYILHLSIEQSDGDIEGERFHLFVPGITFLNDPKTYYLLGCFWFIFLKRLYKTR